MSASGTEARNEALSESMQTHITAQMETYVKLSWFREDIMNYMVCDVMYCEVSEKILLAGGTDKLVNYNF